MIETLTTKHKTFALVAGLLGILIVSAGILWPLSGLLLPEKTYLSTDLVHVSGLPANEPIEISLLSTKGEEPEIRQKYTTDRNGKATIPLQSVSGKNLPDILKVSVRSQDAPVELRMQMFPETQKIAVSASGLNEFSNVNLTKGSSEIATKADWSGALHIDDLPLSSPEGPVFERAQFAFYTNDIMNDAVEENPLIIDVFLAGPWGGWPGSERVNEYEETYCKSSSDHGIDMSTCVDARMKQQIEWIEQNYDRAHMMMTEQFSAVMMQYVQTIGSFLDGKTSLETQRLHNTLTAQAHKDYHPSEQMCQFGSFVRSIGKVERKAAHEQQAINKILMERYANVEHTSTSEGYALDSETRLRQFREVFCDPRDNNDGLRYICNHNPESKQGGTGSNLGGPDPARYNNDIDYARTLGIPLTVDVNFLDQNKSDSEEDIIALARNLYWPRPFEYAQEEAVGYSYPEYLDTRRVAAMFNVAHNSFAHMVATKSQSQEDSQDSGARYMKALMKQFGLSDDEIHRLLGDYPSYYSQMDVLTKKMYQSPDFFTNLLDKPVNVDRIGASMDAIKVMQLRDWHETSLRSEMLTSLLIEEALAKHIDQINSSIGSGTGRQSSLED